MQEFLCGFSPIFHGFRHGVDVLETDRSICIRFGDIAAPHELVLWKMVFDLNAGFESLFDKFLKKNGQVKLRSLLVVVETDQDRDMGRGPTMKLRSCVTSFPLVRVNAEFCVEGASYCCVLARLSSGWRSRWCDEDPEWRLSNIRAERVRELRSLFT